MASDLSVRHSNLPLRLAILALLALILFLAAPRVHGATYFVRTDGGSATQCTGTSDAPYHGSGSAQPCAWDHPFRALPPGATPRIAGGDTLLIASGSYMMGFGAPETESCDPDGSWLCVMPPIPSGTSERPTQILGNCSMRGELWGTEHAELVVNLTGSSNVELGCLEITDHSTCVDEHTGSIPCKRDAPPFGAWAARGIYASDSANVMLHDLDIHGLAAAGVHAGRLRNWNISNVRIAANGWVGWDGDIDGDDYDEGVMWFSSVVVEWNGCGETWPGKVPVQCWGQTAGGYGDGLGTGATHGNWIIDDSKFLNNTSDGLDLLYVREGGSITIRRTLASGNAGNQLKTAGPATLENDVVVGNCGSFNGSPVTFNVDDCRAAGNALAMFLYPGDKSSVVNSTIASEGDCVVFAGCAEGHSCNGTERLTLRNNILVGGRDFLDPTDRSASLYWEGLADSSVDADYSIVFGAKEDVCPGIHDFCGVDPLVVNGGVDTFDARLRAGSPAIGAALQSAAPQSDYAGRIRDAAPDIGAYEYGTRRHPVRRAMPPD